jgi:uncharacterized RDD family membrane protein YckC
LACENDRLAQIFIWKQAGVTDLEYARQILSVVNPGALPVLAGEDPPVRFFTVYGPWPDDPWARALADMRSVPNPGSSHWADTTRYDLAGWQGVDQRTGDHLFIITAYRKSNFPPGEAIQVAPAPAPTYTTVTVPQVPYYPQQPTGPLNWPPRPEQEQSEVLPHDLTTEQARSAHFLDSTGTAASPSQPQLEAQSTQGKEVQASRSRQRDGTATTPTLSPLYSKAIGAEVPALATDVLLPDSYAPYYVGFGPRLVAALLDFLFMGVLQLGTLFLVVRVSENTQVNDFASWLSAYAPLIGLGLLLFSAYHIVQWTVWGTTLGKHIMNIRVVGANGQRLGFVRALVRMLGYFFSLSIGGLGGFLMIAFDPRRQGLHDKLADTYVVPYSPRAIAPRGLPGYATTSTPRPDGTPTRPTTPATITPPTTSMAAATVAGNQAFEAVELTPTVGRQTGARDFRGFYSQQGTETVLHLPELPDDPYHSNKGIDEPDTQVDLAGTQGVQSVFGGPITGPLGVASVPQQQSNRSYMTERARELYRQGVLQMSDGVQPSERGYKVEPGFARMAALAFKGAVELVPNSVVYRYLYGVALRYAEGFEVAISEFRRVLDLDPNYYEARQQIAYGPRWHDAFSYTPWLPALLASDGELPAPLMALLPASRDPVTRLVLLREGSSKVVSVLTKTPASAWARPLTDDIPAHINMTLSRTPHGPIIAFYLVVEDKPGDPYKGETFLNPHDPGYPTYDACQLGQNLVAQLSKQDHTYLIFVDENNRLILSRRLNFDPTTQVTIAQCLYDIQTLPAQAMDVSRFQQAAQWHMQNFSLDQVE